jgi:subtilase family serine protease
VDIAIDNIFVDEHCRVWVRWINKGTVKIDKVMRESVFVGSIQSSDLNHVVLAPGAVFAHGVGADPGIKVSGGTMVTAMIDADNVLKEKDENNNRLTITLTCGKTMPDLIPTYFQCHNLQNYTDSQGRNCNVFAVSISVKNFGSRDITEPFTVKLEKNSGPNLSYVNMKTFTVPGLAAGASLKFTPEPQADSCSWYLQNPNLTVLNPLIRVTVDSGGVVTESLENNNQETISTL